VGEKPWAPGSPATRPVTWLCHFSLESQVFLSAEWGVGIGRNSKPPTPAPAQVGAHGGLSPLASEHTEESEIHCSARCQQFPVSPLQAVSRSARPAGVWGLGLDF
jgi:hypothetical protein